MLSPRFGRRGVLPRAAVGRIDAGSLARVRLTHAENEALKPCGSYLAADANLENLESADVVAGDAHCPVRNPRYAWVGAVIVDDPIGQPWPARNGRAR